MIRLKSLEFVLLSEFKNGRVPTILVLNLNVGNLEFSCENCHLFRWDDHFRITVFMPVAWSQAQDEDAAIEKLVDAGGRVMQIAADSENREVSLYLAGEAITDEHVALLKQIAKIHWLNLANTSVTDEGLENIAGLSLTKLHLEKTGVGDAGMVHLKDLAELEYLNLYATNVTNEGLKHLVGLKKLKKLYVWQSAVDEEGMQWLREQLPELTVIGEVKMEPVVVEEEKPVEEKAKEKSEEKSDDKAEDEKDKSEKSDKKKSDGEGK